MIQIRGSKYSRSNFRFIYRVLVAGFEACCPEIPKYGIKYCCKCEHHTVCKDIDSCLTYLGEKTGYGWDSK